MLGFDFGISRKSLEARNSNFLRKKPSSLATNAQKVKEARKKLKYSSGNRVDPRLTKIYAIRGMSEKEISKNKKRFLHMKDSLPLKPNQYSRLTHTAQNSPNQSPIPSRNRQRRNQVQGHRDNLRGSRFVKNPASKAGRGGLGYKRITSQNKNRDRTPSPGNSLKLNLNTAINRAKISLKGINLQSKKSSGNEATSSRYKRLKDRVSTSNRSIYTKSEHSNYYLNSQVQVSSNRAVDGDKNTFIMLKRRGDESKPNNPALKYYEDLTHQRYDSLGIDIENNQFGLELSKLGVSSKSKAYQMEPQCEVSYAERLEKKGEIMHTPINNPSDVSGNVLRSAQEGSVLIQKEFSCAATATGQFLASDVSFFQFLINVRPKKSQKYHPFVFLLFSFQ